MSAMNDDIAIVGFSFKLPQDVDDVSSFWDVLENKRNLMTEWPESRISNGSFEASKEGNVRRIPPLMSQTTCSHHHRFDVGEVIL